MAAKRIDTDWMWHPHFTENRTDTAGLFVHFRRRIVVKELPISPLKIQITADTRYKLYVNNQLVASGPVKGDQHMWFYDELDLAPFLIVGENKIAVHVLRFFHATSHAASFARLPMGGLMIRPVECDGLWTAQLQSSSLWETAIDHSTILLNNQAEDDFLHVYEHHSIKQTPLEWMPAKPHQFQASTGIGSPWKLSPRLIPPMRFRSSPFHALHNIRSQISWTMWEEMLLRKPVGATHFHKPLRLQAHTSHYVELEVENHTTALLRFLFQRPTSGGSVLAITYAESYEDPPLLVPYLRSKDDRCDDTKTLFGPQDMYTFSGGQDTSCLGYGENEDKKEIFAPFHYRTFRFIALHIDVGSTDLVLEGIDCTTTNYPLDASAKFSVGNCQDKGVMERLWTTSIRTLENCMHDCYEDCPFYEQLQYAMDMRSSALFTYYVSGDDRLARQAIIQIHNSFEPRLGLTSSRAPSHQPQVIPHFSLYWICALRDHLNFFGDVTFLRRFVSVIDGILEFFNSGIDLDFKLVNAKTPDNIWNFTDWTDQWRPYGIPPAAERTGVSTYTNCLYAYTLQNAAAILQALGRSSLAEEYLERAGRIVEAVRTHCFDGTFFTDGLAIDANPKNDYSQHSQVWAILCGAATGLCAQEMLRRCLDPSAEQKFTQTSLSMSFYTLRALSVVGGDLYNQHFTAFWEPWRKQLCLNLTTWEEDSVSQRSDCHAWGSSPIYEFMAEVAGITPAKPGWEVINFQPRLGLYPELNAKVPIRDSNGVTNNFAHVHWDTEMNGDINVSLIFETQNDVEDLVVHINLPLQALKIFSGVKEFKFVVPLEENQSSLSGYESGAAS